MSLRFGAAVGSTSGDIGAPAAILGIRDAASAGDLLEAEHDVH